MLRNPALQNIEFHGWHMCEASLNFLESEIQRLKPSLILELGSGASTVCFHQFLEDLAGRMFYGRIISIEQDEGLAQSLRERLAVSPNRIPAVVIHVPVYEYGYRFDENLMAILGEAQPDFLVIDGPSGELGCRAKTLPDVAGCLAPNAAIYMDDAYRDAEIIESWKAEGLLHVDQILGTERGLMVGRRQ